MGSDGTAYIPNNYVGIVEKLWSRTGSVAEGRIIATHDEAGYQADLLRGGFHFGLWRWQYRIHRVRLVTIPQGKIGYVYARDGEPLEAQPDAGPRRRVQELPGRAGVSRRRRLARAVRAASAAASGPSCAKACTRSTWRCSS